jgi:hypothetical protein
MRPGPASLRHHNAVMACLREAGFSFQTASTPMSSGCGELE